eukprot:3564617-Alexandrium_andersonii.AAC.1
MSPRYRDPRAGTLAAPKLSDCSGSPSSSGNWEVLDVHDGSIAHRHVPRGVQLLRGILRERLQLALPSGGLSVKSTTALPRLTRLSTVAGRLRPSRAR